MSNMVSTNLTTPDPLAVLETVSDELKPFPDMVRKKLFEFVDYSSFESFVLFDAVLRALFASAQKAATQRSSPRFWRVFRKLESIVQALLEVPADKRGELPSASKAVHNILKAHFALLVSTGELQGYVRALGFLLERKTGLEVRFGYEDVPALSGGAFSPRFMLISLNRLAPEMHTGRHSAFAVAAHELAHYLYTYLPVVRALDKSHEKAAQAIEKLLSLPEGGVLNLVEDRRIETRMAKRFVVCAAPLKRHAIENSVALIEFFHRRFGPRIKVEDLDGFPERDRRRLILAMLGYPLSVVAVKDRYRIGSELPDDPVEVLRAAGVTPSSREERFALGFAKVVCEAVERDDVREVHELVRRFLEAEGMLTPEAAQSDESFLKPHGATPPQRTLVSDDETLPSEPDESADLEALEQDLDETRLRIIDEAAESDARDERQSSSREAHLFLRWRAKDRHYERKLAEEHYFLRGKMPPHQLKERHKAVEEAYRRGVVAGRRVALTTERELSLNEDYDFDERGRRFDVRRYVRAVSAGTSRRDPRVFRVETPRGGGAPPPFTVDAVLDASGSMDGYPLEKGAELMAFLQGFAEGLAKQRIPVRFNLYATGTTFEGHGEKALILPLAEGGRERLLERLARIRTLANEGFSAYRECYEQNRPLILFVVTDGQFVAKECEALIGEIKENRTLTVGAYLFPEETNETAGDLIRSILAESLAKFHVRIAGSDLRQVEDFLKRTFCAFVEKVLRDPKHPPSPADLRGVQQTMMRRGPTMTLSV
ncbi:vWA domain-containing protein [Thermosulfurimonas sp. F29]|uniref:vWA domain-containing protein n=1 Tax=Thermosulfurimonas sp. F29 TaxID=2867247 RepID=UPI001C82ED7D|nr:vWA domain-containing protein [Thermosulfurimonas sp. F29]MBX6424164.1 VWA domain-containing protein [Thermosulfurimonas sp. F29]